MDYGNRLRQLDSSIEGEVIEEPKIKKNNNIRDVRSLK